MASVPAKVLARRGGMKPMAAYRLALAAKRKGQELFAGQGYPPTDWEVVFAGQARAEGGGLVQAVTLKAREAWP